MLVHLQVSIMEGWIKIYRSITDHWIWGNPDYFKAWITMLMTVNYEKKQTLVDGEILICDRGQSLLSLSSWANLFKWKSVKRVRTFFELLEKDGIIVREGLRKTTRVTICKYDSYQGNGQTEGTQRARSGHAAGTHGATTKEGKKGKKERNINNIIPELPFLSLEFANSWNDWCTYRKEKGKTLSPTSIKKQLDFLKTVPESEAIEIINNSIMNGWQGLFPLKNKTKPPVNPYKIQ